MSTTPPSDEYAGCAVPPEVYDVAFGWDPQPEVQRLLFLAREAGATVRSALELGCGTGRLLAALQGLVPEVVGIELNPVMAAFAQRRCAAEITVGDMSDFALGRTFDLIFTSANTIRHVLDPAAIARMWRCVSQYLAPGGVFVADLELGLGAEADRLAQPVKWMLSRGDTLVHVTWTLIEAPTPESRRSTIEWTFERRRGEQRDTWRESFCLRAYDAEELAQIAAEYGGLRSCRIHEPRDPYLLKTPIEKAIGRMLVTLTG